MGGPTAAALLEAAPPPERRLAVGGTGAPHNANVG
jgi:hypothetical protein